MPGTIPPSSPTPLYSPLAHPTEAQGESPAHFVTGRAPRAPREAGGIWAYVFLMRPPHRAPRRGFSGKSSLFPTRARPIALKGKAQAFSCTSRILNTSPLAYRARAPYPASRSPRPSSPFARRTRKYSRLARRDGKGTSPVARRTRPRQRPGLHYQLDSPVVRRTKPAWRQGPDHASGLRRRGLPRFPSVLKRTKSTHFQPTL